MRILGRILLVLLGAVLLLGALAYLFPREVTVERSIEIAAPPEEVFPHVNSLQRFAEWSPWQEMDADMQQSFSGPEQGVGNRMEWSSDNPSVGSGSQEITLSIPGQRVETALDFGNMGTARAWHVLEPARSGTEVTWGLLADMGNWPVGRYMGLMMDRWVGADYERGLARLKDRVEGG
jgi:uncharacterized protein YndB with AHSA1/START domain